MFFFNVLLLLVSSLCIIQGENLSLEQVYKKGLQAYSRQDWSECVIQFEESITLYKLYKTIIINCRHKCKSRQYENIINEDVEDLKSYELLFHISNCLMVCQETEFDRVSLENNIPDTLLIKMSNLQPYEYLQVCYYHTNHLQKAASAAATYLAVHPDDSIMRSNLQQYLRLSKLNPDKIYDLEAEKYTLLYAQAITSYTNKEWSETVDYMENTIKNYLSSEQNCRAECEQLPEQEWSSELMITLSNAVAAFLDCRQNCQTKLKSIGYKSGLDFLSESLNYLQISYYNIDKIEDAAKATASFLLMKPDDEVMLENRKIYSSLTNTDSFVERTDIQYYMKRDNAEKELLELYLRESNDVYNTETK